LIIYIPLSYQPNNHLILLLKVENINYLYSYELSTNSHLILLLKV